MKGKQTSKMLRDLQSKRNVLYRRIQLWRAIQLIYMPQVATLLSTEPATIRPDNGDEDINPIPTASTQVESLLLWLPSLLPADILSTPSLLDITSKECCLRIAQADDALAEICHQHRIMAGLYQFKKLNVSGTGNKLNMRM